MNVRAPVFTDRYANWIKGSEFSLNGCVNELTTNDGPKHLHGGVMWFEKVILHTEEIPGDEFYGLRTTFV